MKVGLPFYERKRGKGYMYLIPFKPSIIPENLDNASVFSVIDGLGQPIMYPLLCLAVKHIIQKFVPVICCCCDLKAASVT